MIKKIFGLLIVAVIILISLYNLNGLTNLQITWTLTPIYIIIFVLVMLFIFYRLARRR
jgi:hypothetical protein